MEDTPQLSSKIPKIRKSRKGSSLKVVNLERATKKLMNILDRDLGYLLVASRSGELNKNQQQAVVNYLKILKDIQKQDEDLGKDMSIEELEKIVNR